MNDGSWAVAPDLSVSPNHYNQRSSWPPPGWWSVVGPCMGGKTAISQL